MSFNDQPTDFSRPTDGEIDRRQKQGVELKITAEQEQQIAGFRRELAGLGREVSQEAEQRLGDAFVDLIAVFGGQLPEAVVKSLTAEFNQNNPQARRAMEGLFKQHGLLVRLDGLRQDRDPAQPPLTTQTSVSQTIDRQLSRVIGMAMQSDRMQSVVANVAERFGVSPDFALANIERFAPQVVPFIVGQAKAILAGIFDNFGRTIPAARDVATLLRAEGEWATVLSVAMAQPENSPLRQRLAKMGEARAKKQYVSLSQLRAKQRSLPGADLARLTPVTIEEVVGLQQAPRPSTDAPAPGIPDAPVTPVEVALNTTSTVELTGGVSLRLTRRNAREVTVEAGTANRKVTFPQDVTAMSVRAREGTILVTLAGGRQETINAQQLVKTIQDPDRNEFAINDNLRLRVDRTA